MKKIDWKAFFLAVSIVFSVFAIPLSMEYGYKEGYATGKSEGYNSGYDAGKERGYNEGINDNSAYLSGYSAGYDDASAGSKDYWYNQGKETGYKLGKSDAKKEFNANKYNSEASSESSGKSNVESSSSTENSITVYITNTGSKYHKANCSYLRESKIAISLSEAKSRGYTPCSRCY